MKQGKGQQSFVNRTLWSQQAPFTSNTEDDSTHGHHQIVNTQIKLTMFFADEDWDALYCQQKQGQELTVA